MTKTRKKQKKHLEDLNEKYYGKNKNVDYKKISIIEQIKRDIDSIFFYNLNFKYNWCKKLFIFSSFHVFFKIIWNKKFRICKRFLT